MALGFSNNFSKNSVLMGVLEDEIAKSRDDMLAAVIRTDDALYDLTQKLRAQLYDANRQFDITASIITDALIVCDIDGTIRSINGTGLALIPNAAVGNNLFDCILGVQRDTMWNDIELGFAMTARNSSLSGNIAKMYKSNGKEIVVVILRNTQNDYENVFNAEIYGLMVVQNNHVVAANKAVADIFGLDDQQNLIGQDVKKYITYADENEIIHSSAVVHYNGMNKNVEISMTPISWNNDNAILFTVETIR